jgi:hypothetical protein
MSSNSNSNFMYFVMNEQYNINARPSNSQSYLNTLILHENHYKFGGWGDTFNILDSQRTS